MLKNEIQWTSPTRLYLDKDGKVCDEKDPNKASLLVGEGGTIPQSQAVELGLIEVTPPVIKSTLAEPKAEEPKEDKAVKPDSNKGAPVSKPK